MPSKPDSLRALMERRGMTPAQLAEATGLSERTIYNVLSGATEPYRTTLQLIATALAIAPAKLQKLLG